MEDDVRASNGERAPKRLHVREVDAMVLRGVVRAATRDYLAAVATQRVDEVTPDEAAGAGYERSHRLMSDSTIIATSSSKLTSGSQPSSRLALLASPMSRSTSAGRTKRGSITTYGSYEP